MAILLTSLMGLAVLVDYGLIVVESGRLQHALDASALAGARALVVSSGANQTAKDGDGETAAINFLGLHGYTVGTRDDGQRVCPQVWRGVPTIVGQP